MMRDQIINIHKYAACTNAFNIKVRTQYNNNNNNNKHFLIYKLLTPLVD